MNGNAERYICGVDSDKIFPKTKINDIISCPTVFKSSQDSDIFSVISIHFIRLAMLLAITLTLFKILRTSIQ
ncbi:hypothetical protein GYMLUDRAFT_33788 [Collybiopsis luxurians FD-317 M1]|nr:hypothetical protein GYMLUDRAFT_33788 [Collybiopsis luxurians FD-317 M1]